MLKALDIRLYPNNIQIEYLNKIFGCYRKVYNLCLDKAKSEYELGENFSSLIDFSNYFHKVLLKSEEYDYLNEHNTKILKDSLSNLQTAYKNFFRTKKGFPKFKTKSIEQSIGLYKEAFSKKVFDLDNHMFINKTFGQIKYKTSREYKELICKYKNEIIRITIKKTKSNEYHALILIESREVKMLSQTDKIVGIDLGIKDFIITSEGIKFENIKIRNKSEKKLIRLQRQLSKKKLQPTGEFKFNKKYNKDVEIKTPSKNREKARLKLARYNEKLNRIKNDYLHQVCNQLLRENQTIVIEDLNVRGMMKNHHLAKSIQDVSLGRFKEILTYKALWYNKEIVEIDRWFPSSKLCSDCGYKYKELKLSEREWICPECGVIHDRDINAAINILNEGLKIKDKIGKRYPEFKLVEHPTMDDRLGNKVLKSSGVMKQEKDLIKYNKLVYC